MPSSCLRKCLYEPVRTQSHPANLAEIERRKRAEGREKRRNERGKNDQTYNDYLAYWIIYLCLESYRPLWLY